MSGRYLQQHLFEIKEDIKKLFFQCRVYFKIGNQILTSSEILTRENENLIK